MKAKLCGLSRPEDIQAANELKPDYIGFVFYPKSKRYVSAETAELLKGKLSPSIQAVGVFVNEDPQVIADLLNRKIIDVAQLHGSENEEAVRKLRMLTDAPIIQAFQISHPDDLKKAEKSPANYILLDSGAGTGETFDWKMLYNIQRPYFLAGGLNPENVSDALRTLHPYAVDVSTGIETDGKKDKNKMTAFMTAVRKEGLL